MSERTPGSRPERSPLLTRLPRGLRETFTRYGIYLGVFAGIYVWVVIVCCALTSPWWGFTQSSFSAFGSSPGFGGKDSQPWIYNDVAMVPTGAMLMLYSVALGICSKNKVQILGSAIFFVAGIFLALVGIFHGGTPWHDSVSAGFFAMALFAVITWGLGLLLEGRRGFGLGMLVTAAIAVVIAAEVNWPSVATVEAFGVAAIDLWLVLMLFAVKRHPVEIGAGPSAG